LKHEQGTSYSDWLKVEIRSCISRTQRKWTCIFDYAYIDV